MNQNNKPLIIGFTIIIVALVIIIALLVFKNSEPSVDYALADAPSLNGQVVTPSKPAASANTQTGSSITIYETTAESKIVKQELTAYITGFEKRSDGYYYISLKTVQINPQISGSQPLATPKMQTFRAGSMLKVYQVGNRLYNPSTYVNFEGYKNSLIKQGDYYVNPAWQDGGGSKATGHYEIFIENGQITSMDEFSDVVGSQG